MNSVKEQRARKDWATFIKNLVDHQSSNADKVIQVMDNLNPHHPCFLYEAFEWSEDKKIGGRLEIYDIPNIQVGLT